MAGHSKWAQIKRQKAKNDQARGKMFSKLAREITVAARQAGGDANFNPRLRTAIDNAKAENMPNENIDRAVKRGTGALPGASYEECTYEGYGPGGVALFLECLTDNQNRTIAEFVRRRRNNAAWGVPHLSVEQKIHHLLEVWGIGDAKAREDGFGFEMLQVIDSDNCKRALEASRAIEFEHEP